MVLSALVFGAIAANPKPVSAIGPSITTIITDIPGVIFRAIDRVRNSIAAAFKDANNIAFKSALQIFEQRLASEILTQVSTAGPGQKPLFLTNPRTFFQNVADSAAGDYIDDFTRGVTGRRGPGGALSETRGRFLISRFLRAQIGSPLEDCRTQCRDELAIQIDESSVKEFTAEELANTGFRNDHERLVAFMRWEIDTFTTPTKDRDENAAVVCKYAAQSAGPLAQGQTAMPWFINLSTCLTATDQPYCRTTAKECLRRQTEAINNEYATAQEQTGTCLRECKTGVAGAVTQAINRATARDIFAAVENIDITRSPAAIANALKRDTSDFGQLLRASATLTAVVQSNVTGEKTRLSADVLPRETRVSGEVITPKNVTASTLGGALTGGDQARLVFTGTTLADRLQGLASFINSPAGKLLFSFFQSKCGLNPDACRGPANAQSSIGRLFFGNGLPTGIAGAKLQFATFGRTELVTGEPGRNEISIPEQLSGSGLIDAQFRTAIEDRLTVAEALSRGLLDRRKTFGFDRDGAQPTTGYSYRALQYLRKFRVTPVGWELAAEYSRRFDPRDLSLGFLTEQYGMCAQQSRSCSNLRSQTCTSDNDCVGPAAGPSGQCNFPEGIKTDRVCSNNYNRQCTTSADCDGAACGASPYCGLVDPNWVLKAPQTYCRRQGAGEEILTKEFVCDQDNVVANPEDPDALDLGEDAPNCVASPQNPNPDVGRWVITRNTETCADTQSCIAENDDGTCLAYGYCVQERQTYKFSGTQCSPEQATCTTYTDDTGREVSYLSNTLDFASCNSEAAGCQWYCTDQDQTSGQWLCSQTTGGRVNFTGAVERCSASQSGCRQFIRTISGTNRLANGGFETFINADIDSGQTADLPGWTKSNNFLTTPVSPSDSEFTSGNTAALKLQGGGGDALSQTVDGGYPLYERGFIGSLRARADSACTARLRLQTDVAAPTQDIAVTEGWATHAIILRVPGSQVATSTSNTIGFVLELAGCANAGLVIDSAQFEESATQTAFKDYGAVNVIHLNGSRRQCAADDVGCEEYTRISTRQKITGQVRDSNRCTADKVGCATFAVEPVTTTPSRPGTGSACSNDSQCPNGGTCVAGTCSAVNLVAPRGQACSAQHVGCEEYTNLDEVARGGEGREYFSRVKQCVKPDHVGRTTYYTWIGDAQRGFVLRANDLLRSNADSGPCTSVSFADTANAVPQCNDTAATIQAATCAAGDLASNADCAEFYDSALNIYYRLRSRTVSVTAECRPYRNTVDQTDADPANDNRVYFLSRNENVQCPSTAASCRAYTGNAGRTTRQVFTDNFDGGSAANWIGGQPSTQSVNSTGRSMFVQPTPGNPRAAAYTKTAVLAGKVQAGKSYLVSFIAAAGSDQVTTVSAAFGIGNGPTFDPSDNQTFPGSGVLQWNAASNPASPEWQTYTLGPLRLAADPGPNLGLLIDGGSGYVDNVTLTEINDSVYLLSATVPLCSQSDIGCDAYRDRSGQTQYLKSFSRLCSPDVVGCEAMIDTQNSASPFAEIVKGVSTPADEIVTYVNDRSTYCPSSAKGCQAFGKPVYGQDQTIANFQTVYLKNNPDRYTLDLCVSSELFCRAYTTPSGTSAFFKDPLTNVCEFRSDSSDSGGFWYVVGTSYRCPTVNLTPQGRPIGPSCSPVCAAGERAGKACVSNSDCPGSQCVGDAGLAGRITGNRLGQCVSDSDCVGGNRCLYQAGICPETANGCTEYRDPSDPISCRSECTLVQQGASPVYVDQNCVRTQCVGNANTNGQNCQSDSQCGANGQCVGLNNIPSVGLPGCRAYTYIRDTVEENSAECNGQIDLEVGCRPFNDSSDSSLNFRGQ